MDDSNSWDCSVCTYRNSAEAFKCSMCDVRKGTSTRKPRINPEMVAKQVARQQEQIKQQALKSAVKDHHRKSSDKSLFSKRFDDTNSNSSVASTCSSGRNSPINSHCSNSFDSSYNTASSLTFFGNSIKSNNTASSSKYAMPSSSRHSINNFHFSDEENEKNDDSEEKFPIKKYGKKNKSTLNSKLKSSEKNDIHLEVTVNNVTVLITEYTDFRKTDLNNFDGNKKTNSNHHSSKEKFPKEKNKKSLNSSSNHSHSGEVKSKSNGKMSSKKNSNDDHSFGKKRHTTELNDNHIVSTSKRITTAASSSTD
ncbi:Nose resistant to fluoxetine protein 6 [Sarcoptes scabiei]|nr:Nose resistant to fluoxetine protein 6 [Sarcoptes scabiei]